MARTASGAIVITLARPYVRPLVVARCATIKVAEGALAFLFVFFNHRLMLLFKVARPPAD
jgi:hypothetical protein